MNAPGRPAQEASLRDVLVKTDLPPPNHITLLYTMVMLMTASSFTAASTADPRLAAFNATAYVIGTVVAARFGWRVWAVLHTPQTFDARASLTWVALGVHLCLDFFLGLAAAVALIYWLAFLMSAST